MGSTSPRVHLAGQGAIEGSLDTTKRVVRFLNVPFGTVPERWRPAVKPAPWSHIRDATKQGPISPQPMSPSRYSRAINSYSEFDFDDDTAVFDEKLCLNLNIFVHEDTLNQSGKSPGAAVMVFIHGGGYKDGANAMDVYDGCNLVRQSVDLGRPIILVVPNYRLNFFGHFSCPELVADLASDHNLDTSSSPSDDYARSTGNWCLQDQRLAFEWVRDHISTVGGDPKNVTAFGESVGAVSIQYHMMIQAHRGLFHRAIMQSCAMNSGPAIHPQVEGRLYFDYLVDYFKIPQELSGEKKLAILKQVPQEELAQASDSDRLRMFTPFVDGTMVPKDVRVWNHETENYDMGVKAVMIGDMKDEGSMFAESVVAATLERWGRVMEKYCPPGSENRRLWDELYGEIKSDEDVRRASIKVAEHLLFTYPDFSALRALSKRKDLKRDKEEGGEFELFQYYFDRSIDAVDAKGKGWGAHHGVDLVFVFGPDLAVRQLFTPEEKRLSEQVQTLWIKFAYGEMQTATTSDGQLLRVPRITRPVDDFKYHAKEKEAIVFTDRCTVEAEHANRQGEKVFQFWERSEKWVHEVREAMKQGSDGNGASYEKGLRTGLLCIAQPSESKWE